MIFDSHAHYDDSAFNEDREEILEEIKKGGVGRVVNAASSLQSIKDILGLTEHYDWIYGSAGIHPSDTAELNENNFKWMSDLIKERKYNSQDAVPKNKIVAVGEIGLDYYWKEPEEEIQKYWFEKQLKLAIEENLPVIIHSRDAAADTLKMIKEAHSYAKRKDQTLAGVIHCFSYGKELAKDYLDMGFYIGVSGVVTFKNAKKMVEVAEYVPLSRIVIETDSPYLSPEPNRGKRNCSENLPYVIRRIAEIKGISEKEAEETTYQNASCLYRI